MESSRRIRAAKPEEMSMHTTLNVVKLRYLWSIKNFGYCDNDLKTPIFSANSLDTFKWQITIGNSSNWISANLQLVSPEAASICIKLSLSMLKSQKDFGIFTARVGAKYEFNICCRRDTLAEDLTISCNIDMMNDTVNSDQTNSFELGLWEYSMSECLSKLLDSKKLSDVTLDVGGTEFRAHKAILASRSDVFAAMFDHDLQEKKTNRIEINDMEEGVVAEMLRFIYSGTSPNLDEMADGLLAAANKYALDDLREMCVSSLIHHLANDTAIQTLIFADLHRADRLKACAMDFINTNAMTILKTELWQILKNEYPRLCIEIYEWQHKLQN